MRHKLIWVVTASGVIRSFAINMVTIFALKEESQIQLVSGMKKLFLQDTSPLLALMDFAFTQLP